MTVAIEGVPASISRQAFIEWLATVGLDATLVRSVQIDRNGIKAVVTALNENGKRYAPGDEIATHTVQIRLDDGNWDANGAVTHA